MNLKEFTEDEKIKKLRYVVDILCNKKYISEKQLKVFNKYCEDLNIKEGNDLDSLVTKELGNFYEIFKNTNSNDPNKLASKESMEKLLSSEGYNKGIENFFEQIIKENK